MTFEYPRHVRFTCDRCAICCGDTEKRVRLILLLKNEAERIARETHRSIREFAEEMLTSKPYVYRIKKTASGKCLFLVDNSCSIYEIRPLICRFYPFQLSSKRGKASFNHTQECPGIGRGPQAERSFFEKLFKESAETMARNEKNDEF